MTYIYFTFPEIKRIIKNGEEKKELVGIPRGWNKLESSLINPDHKCKALITGRIKDQGITAFDFDNMESFYQFWDDHKHLNIYDYKMVKTPRGMHVYFEYDEDCKHGVDCLDKYKNVDIRNDGGFIICPPTSYVSIDGIELKYEDLGGKILPVPSELKQYLKSNKKQPKSPKSKLDGTLMEELSDLIDIKYIDNYHDWIRIVFSLASENLYDLAKVISMKSSKFEDQAFETVWKSNKNKISLGTIHYYAKLSNEKEYLQIMTKYKSKNIDEVIKSPTQENMARCFYEIFGEDFIYIHDVVYFYNGIYWEQSKTALRRKFTNEFTNLFIDKQIYFMTLMKQHDSDSDEYKSLKTKCDDIKKIIVQLQTNKNIKDVCNDAIKVYIERSDITFEMNPYMFCFKNKAFDLKNMTWLDTTYKYDYMCLSTGYDWIEPTQQQIHDLNLLIDQIFTIPEEKTLYMTILATGLFGQTLEKFILANGSGRNGKGVINELAGAMFGNYYYQCGNSILLNPIDCKGANQTLAGMNHKRFVVYREPTSETTIKLNTDTIKELTGGSSINARGLYEKNTTTHMKGTHILECNKRPLFSGETNDASIKRFIDFLFRSKFTSDEQEVDHKSVFPMNIYYKSTEFQESMKYALFKILIDYWGIYLQSLNIDLLVPETIRERGFNHLKDSDEFMNWFEDTYEKVDDEDQYIKMKDIFHLFKESTYYCNLSKANKRITTKTKLFENMKNNYFLKKAYRERFQKNGKDDTSVFLGYKLREE